MNCPPGYDVVIHQVNFIDRDPTFQLDIRLCL